MITITCSIALLGFYILYSTSRRAELVLKYRFQKWVNENKKIGKPLGIGLLFISLLFSIAILGFGAGVFSFLVILMTSGSLVVLLSPLRFFNLSTVMIITIVCFIVETLFT